TRFAPRLIQGVDLHLHTLAAVRDHFEHAAAGVQIGRGPPRAESGRRSSASNSRGPLQPRYTGGWSGLASPLGLCAELPYLSVRPLISGQITERTRRIHLHLS